MRSLVVFVRDVLGLRPDPWQERILPLDPETWPEVCGDVLGTMTCRRRPDHDGPHADPFTGRGDRPVEWWGPSVVEAPDEADEYDEAWQDEDDRPPCRATTRGLGLPGPVLVCGLPDGHPGPWHEDPSGTRFGPVDGPVDL